MRWLSNLNLVMDATAPRLARVRELRDQMSAYDAAYAAAEALEAPLVSTDSPRLSACEAAAIPAVHLADLARAADRAIPWPALRSSGAELTPGPVTVKKPDGDPAAQVFHTVDSKTTSRELLDGRYLGMRHSGPLLSQSREAVAQRSASDRLPPPVLGVFQK